MVDNFSGRNLHGYEIREKIGEGGYGAVYRGYQSAVDREVAIKVILPRHANEPEFARRFDQEAHLIAQLEHPHIIPLYDYWTDHEGAFLIMRYLRGGSLQDVLARQGVCSLAQTARLLDQITEALSVAHTTGIVHRDLKPANILLDERGNAYLSDFGIAKDLHNDVRATPSEAVIGSPAYLSPEQIKSETVSPQSDIYSLGILLYEILVGEHPLGNVNVMLMINKHLHEPLPRLHEKRPTLPVGLQRVINTATAKDPAERYRDAMALARDFREAVGLNPADEPPTVILSRKTPVLRANSPKKPESYDERNRYFMLQNVRRFWIEGVLDNSLHGATLIDLGMRPAESMVDHPWDTLLRAPGSLDKTLPVGTKILDVFDKMNGKLLILGEPGGGKTTMLLELARDLLDRAEQDNAHPIPAVFNLSSWSEGQKPIIKWLIDELHHKYQVPKKVAQAWVDHDHLLLLLDGLDEVAMDHREACVQAINTYRDEHGFVDIVVCSRIADYELLSNKLKLNGAIVLKSLTTTQVDQYLSALGSQMAAVRAMLTEDEALREMSQSPLMLSIMTLAYYGVTQDELPALETIEARRRHLFDVYVQRMFERRVGAETYPLRDTVHYLSWLAHKMLGQGQSVFSIENLQPAWLDTIQQRRRYVLDVCLFTGTLLGVITGLIFGVLAHDVGIGALMLLFMIPYFGLLTGIYIWRRTIKVVEAFKWSFRRSIFGFIIADVAVIVAGFITYPGINYLQPTAIIWLIYLGVCGFLIFGWARREVVTRTYPNQGMWQSARNTIYPFSAFIATLMLLGGLFRVSLARIFPAALFFGLGGGSVIGIALFGGLAVIQHGILRYTLYRKQVIPRNYAHFLDHAAHLIFLRKVGGSYIFVHRMLLEYFAESQT